MVMDPFDDVRSLSASLLKRSVLVNSEYLDSDHLGSYILLAKHRMIENGRANASDGYALLVELSYVIGHTQEDPRRAVFCTPQAALTDICDSLALASSNLQAAVAEPQLHGQFSALR